MSGGVLVAQQGRRVMVKRMGGVLLAALLLAGGLSACSEAARPATAPSTSSAGAPPQASTQGSSDPAVAEITKTVDTTLKNVVASSPKPDQKEVRSALVAAGIPQANVEVSAGRTPTGLDVDAMEAAALVGESCVMGQIRDGSVAVTVLPVLSTGKCFIGDAR
ncbi:DUF6993 domain-containing protein [Paenarthrobacter sp. NPDC058040]|uniref:DUF6993 domain-containing protein n=1 Tax=unclassified Paenarthrobacter TaxID=2634190 RepID=UPI0036DE9142